MFIISKNPANKEVLAEIEMSSREQIIACVDKAKSVQKKWKQVLLQERLELVGKFRKHIFKQKEIIAKLITNETGKPYVEALAGEIFGVLETCEWLENNAQKILAQKPVDINQIFFTGKHSYNTYEPLGVVAIIAPYNYPFSIPVSTILAAIVAGNAIVLKPSPKAALTGQLIEKLFLETGFPDGLIGLVQGDKEEVKTLIETNIDRVMFTGSVFSGKAIMSLAANKLIPVTLELGGNHAAIVLKDIDVDKAAGAIVWSAFTNTGQACASINRLYVEKDIYEKLVNKIVELTKKLRLGNGLDANIDIGPLIDEHQLNHVQERVDAAVKEGAKILMGGKIRRDLPGLSGYFFEPTVLGNVENSMKIVQEEIFGPVLPIVPVVSHLEAVKYANETDYGLAASIWTNDLAVGEKIAKDLHVGIVWINDGLYSHVCPDAPWGGVKNSGFNRMHSACELQDLVYVKNIGISKLGVRDWHYPYSSKALNYVKAGINLIHGKSIIEKLKAIKDSIAYKLKI